MYGNTDVPPLTMQNRMKLGTEERTFFYIVNGGRNICCTFWRDVMELTGESVNTAILRRYRRPRVTNDHRVPLTLLRSRCFSLVPSSIDHPLSFNPSVSFFSKYLSLPPLKARILNIYFLGPYLLFVSFSPYENFNVMARMVHALLFNPLFVFYMFIFITIYLSLSL